MSSAENRQSLPLAGMLHLFVVYIVWGSTYLAIRYAVRDGAGFPPMYLGGFRTLFAGLVLVLYARFRHGPFKLSKRDWSTLTISGVLLWVGGNGTVNWAEQHVHSGYAALIVGSMPMTTAIIEAIIDKRLPSMKLVAATVLGFSGIGILSWPMISNGGSADIIAVLALIFATVSWGIGSIFQARRRPDLPPSTLSGIQQLAGMLGFFLIALSFGEPFPTPTTEASIAFVYLVIAGSIIAFTSYVQALRLLPISVVMTYSYVNPVIAVFLGWLLLHEPVTMYTFVGTAFVLLGVAGVFSAKRKLPSRS